MRFHLRRSTVTVRHRIEPPPLLVLVLGIVLTLVGLVAVATHAGEW